MYIDTHLDTLWQMNKVDRIFSERSEPDKGHIDLVKAKEGELFIGFFTGYPNNNSYSTESMLRKWIEFANEPKNKIQRIISKPDLKNHYDNWQENKSLGAVLHFEGAAGIDTELNRLYIYHEMGLRSMGVTWNEQNQFATGLDGDPLRGFTKEGFDLLSAMEDLGIIIDVSHLNDLCFWDVVNTTNSPIIASHSNLRGVADHPRNLTDEMVQAIVDTGGSIGMNFCNAFLSTEEGSPATRDHVFHMINEVIGLSDVNHVHIGSDFDGCKVPDDIKDVSTMTSFFTDLQAKYSMSDADIRKIESGNMIRIMNEVWKS